MKLKRWIWDILQDGRDHWFDQYNEFDSYGCGRIRYGKDMFLPDGKIDKIEESDLNYNIPDGYFVRKYHVEQEIIVILPEELFEI